MSVPEAAPLRDLIGDTPLIDAHNDLPYQLGKRFGGRLEEVDLHDTRGLDPPLHTDLRRLRAGGVGAQFWAAYVSTEHAGPGAARRMLDQVDLIHRMAAAAPDVLEAAVCADDVERIHASGRIASLIGLEGGHGIESSLGVLRAARARGALYLTLTHNDPCEWADSATADPVHDGLSDFGGEVVRELNRLGMMVDLSHTSPATMRDALEVSGAPLVFTHSGARAVTDHPRNVPDDVIERVAEGGGLVMATFVPRFVSEAVREHHDRREAEVARLRARHPGEPERRAADLLDWEAAHPAPSATLGDVADHLDHLRDVAGGRHVGIGSDFDGIKQVPVGLEDPSRFPALLQELARRGWDESDLRGVAGANLLRVLRAVEEAARL